MDMHGALVEGVTQEMIAFLVEDTGAGIEEAVSKVYGSAVFGKLADKGTGLCRESPAYVFMLLRDELAHGRIVQNEI